MIRLLTILVLFLGFACTSETNSCFNKAGSSITKEVSIQGFNSLAVFENINVEINIDTVYSVQLRAPEHLIHFIDYQIKDSTLVLNNSVNCNVLKSYKNDFTVIITVPTIDSIYAEGYGNITSNDTIFNDKISLNLWDGSTTIDLKINTCDFVIANHLGSNTIYASGNCNYLSGYNNLYGWAYLSELKVKNASINQAGIGDFVLCVSDLITYDISASGNIQLYCVPSIIEGSSSATGELIK